VRYNDYDRLAPGYAADNAENASNSLYERPASLALAGDVAGRRVLDAGCGAGLHAAGLRAAGATVTGIDASAGMLALARQQLGPDVPLLHTDLAAPLPFAADSFDLVMAALVLHYLPDWAPTLREFHRVLTPGGALVVSTHHPFMDHHLAGAQNYFATYPITEEWHKKGHSAVMRFFHRPLTAMTAAFAEAGFALTSLTEPMPVPETETRYPDDYRSLTTRPRFLFFRLTA
jgi:SAM-dependent methyltransferase